jgi:hypothetical protein
VFRRGQSDIRRVALRENFPERPRAAACLREKTEAEANNEFRLPAFRLAGLNIDEDPPRHRFVGPHRLRSNCLEKARAWRSKFIFLSTSRVYPIGRLEAHPWREETTRFVWEDDGTPGISSRGVAVGVDLAGVRSLYGCTKLAAEQLIEE